jgi:hypothetical protein
MIALVLMLTVHNDRSPAAQATAAIGFRNSNGEMK